MNNYPLDWNSRKDDYKVSDEGLKNPIDWNRIDPNILFRRFLFRRYDHDVWLINLRYMMDKLDADFTQAGNAYAKKYIPFGQFWVDDTINPAEYDHDLLHEFLEEMIMKILGWEYNKAHLMALTLEVLYMRAKGLI